MPEINDLKEEDQSVLAHVIVQYGRLSREYKASLNYIEDSCQKKRGKQREE